MKARKLFLTLLVTAVSCPMAFGQGPPATTAAASWNTNTISIPANDGKWHTVQTVKIKNPTADDDLFIDVSQVNAITTTVVASSANLPGTISTGDAKLQMRVLVDGVVAKPGAIVFDEQLLQLTATLAGFLTLNCVPTPVTSPVVTTSCTCANLLLPPLDVVSCSPTATILPPVVRTCSTATTTETDTIPVCTLGSSGSATEKLLLGETLGHAYDFFAPGVGGMGNTHTVQVQEKLTKITTNGGTALAVIGPRTLKIDAVNTKP